MLQLERVRTLRTATPAEEGRPSFVAAASGLVHHQGAAYVVADDEQSLARFGDDAEEGTWIRLLAGDLPLDPELRKAVKADFETLTLLPPFQAAPHGALFALGSGSHLRRRWGALLPLDADHRPLEPARKVDLQPLFQALREQVPLLNIEGCLVLGDALVLLQRGTAGKSENALVMLDLARVQAALASRAPLEGELVKQLIPVALPSLGNAPLGFTDGVSLGRDRIAFTAVAEQTDDPYLDGTCVGSVVGALTVDGRVLGVEAATPVAKLEGLAIVGDRLWLVSDDDDPQSPAVLFQARLPSFLE